MFTFGTLIGVHFGSLDTGCVWSHLLYIVATILNSISMDVGVVSFILTYLCMGNPDAGDV